METEGFSFYIILGIILSILGLVVLSRRPSPPSDDNVIRKNVKRRCRECGAQVMVDVFTVNPTCINCQDRAISGRAAVEQARQEGTEKGPYTTSGSRPTDPPG